MVGATIVFFSVTRRGGSGGGLEVALGLLGRAQVGSPSGGW